MKLTKYRIVYLHITTWQGISLGAIHYYGKLHGGGREVKLQHPLTAEQAAQVNKSAFAEGMAFGFKVGEMYHGFDDRQEIIRLARSTWREHFPDADVLVVGNPCVAEPQRVLHGPKRFKAKVNGWLHELYKTGWDYQYRAQRRQASDAFWKYFCSHDDREWRAQIDIQPCCVSRRKSRVLPPLQKLRACDATEKASQSRRPIRHLQGNGSDREKGYRPTR